MGRDLQGNELGRRLYQRKDGLYQARVYASGYSKPICFYGHDVDELKQKRVKWNHKVHFAIKSNKKIVNLIRKPLWLLTFVVKLI